VDPTSVADFIGNWGYLALLLALLATGVLSPVPEDVLLIAAGYLISAGVFRWHLSVPICVAGVVGSDVVLYWWGTWIRRGVGGRWSRQVVRPDRLARVGRRFERFGDAAVFLARLLPGTRAVAFVGAGLRGMSVRRFLLYDTFGALIWVPLLTWLGTQLGEEVGGLERVLAQLTRVGGWIVVGVLVMVVIWYFRRGEESKL
jgi:membrane protein DedA with SNARE-associated domain